MCVRYLKQKGFISLIFEFQFKSIFIYLIYDLIKESAKVEDILAQSLKQREKEQGKRSLKKGNTLADFCSNDYLGFARKNWLPSSYSNGSTGSRLIRGHSNLYEKAEEEIAVFHRAESGLIFNSGYMANLGLFSCIPQKGDTVIYDQYVHTSIRDGLCLGRARSFSFLHNDLNDLKKKIRRASGTIFIGAESVYSMDGDEAPLVELAEICEKHDTHLIVDEAHATGVFGKLGRGLCEELGIKSKVFVRMHTFSKALGCHGAIVLTSPLLKDYLINFARPFIYSTTLPPHNIDVIRQAYRELKQTSEIERLHQNINYFLSLVSEEVGSKLITSRSAVQSVVIGNNRETNELAAHMQSRGFDIRPILYPSVPKNSERIRICIHSYNSIEEIKALAISLNHYFKRESIHNRH